MATSKTKCWRKQGVQISKGMILPYFDYGDVLYLGGNANLLIKCPVLQNRAIQVCLWVHKRFPAFELHIKWSTKQRPSRRELHRKLLAHHFTTQQQLTMRALTYRHTSAKINYNHLQNIGEKCVSHGHTSLEQITISSQSNQDTGAL